MPEAIDQQNTTAGATGAIFGAGGLYEEDAQSFIPSGNIDVNKVIIKTFKSGIITDNLIVRIETDNAGEPSGNLVHANATKSLAAGSVAHNAETTFTFPATFALANGVTYWIVVSRSGGRDVVNYVRTFWDNAFSNPYANGTEAILDNGVWGDRVNSDIYFKVYRYWELKNAVFFGSNF